MTIRLVLAILSIAALGPALVGCGGPYKVAPVSGKVTLDGQPLANVNVVFQPTGTKSGTAPGPGSMATTDAQGQYTLNLISESPQPGAVVGSHKVSFAPAVQKPNPGQEIATPNPLASKIPTESLDFEVPAAGTNQANFDLKSTSGPASPGRSNASRSSS